MNPFISPNVFTQLPKDVKLLMSDYLLTPEASMKQLRSQFELVKHMEAIDDIKLISSDNLPEGLDFDFYFNLSINIYFNTSCFVCYFS